jgi:hypothetical protein
LVSFGPGAGSYAIQVSGRGNAVCAAALTLEVLKFELAATAAAMCWQSNGTFDAKALLTPASTTNESLVEWSILGVGPATIDTAGLVSFGAGPGSYSVQVAGRSNALCGAALALEVLNLEFATNAAAVCWQSGGTFNARALLTSNSTTNDSRLGWTITCDGPASIDGAGVVSFGSAGGSYIVRVTGHSNMLCAAAMVLDVPKLEFSTNAAVVCWQTNGAFDAKALLTADSITNESLVEWTITGSGPATIDSAGVVNFGSAPGSYTVQVTDRSNTVCVTALALEVLNLKFATNAAAVCWQSGGTFNARSLLTANSTTNDSLLTWTIDGSGPATIDSAGLVNLGPSAGSYTILVAGRGNAACAAALTLDVIKLDLATNAVTVPWQSSGIYNAKALLTPGCATNDSLVTWTISGGPTASINSAGVVSFGSGPGDYTVQVAGRSNSACVASLALSVVRLEFASAEALVCWQSNGTLNAKALLTPGCTTNDSLVTWTISGSPPASINGAGVVTFGSGGSSYTVQVVARSNAACSASFVLRVIRLEFGSSQALACWQSNGVFDAKALLTTNSTTDDSLLRWTISGSPPASIDGAGTVSLGTGGANYAVQVAARSNAACAATLSLGVTKVQFVKRTATMAWQTNATFDARALLAPDGLTNAGSLTWSISGSPSANINTSGVVTLGSGGGSYSIQATAKGALPCSDALTLNAIEARLLSISFVDAGTGSGGDNQHVLYENADPQNWGDGGAITNPVWIAPVSGTNGPPVRNVPACYTCSGTNASKVRAQVAFNVKPAGQTFDFIGLDQSTEYFRTNGVLSTGTNQVIDVVASMPLPGTIQKLTKTFTWRAVVPNGGSGLIFNTGQSTQTIYTVYATPITVVEAQTNRPTPYRLDFCIVGVAAGLSNKVDICDQIATEVRNMTGDSYGGMIQNPRWAFYAESLPRNLDCHHRAALAASGFGVLGIQGYVHRTFSTCWPVPQPPQYYPANTTVNDYEGTYLSSTRLKYRQVGSEVHKLLFFGNNFEGCVRVEDGSADDGNTWWTIWPLKRHENAKALIIYYTADVVGCPERWEKTDGTWVADETVPIDHLADKPKVIGGPD